MEFQMFDKNGMDYLRAEVRARWGTTEAYRQYLRKESGDKANDRESQWRSIFAEIGALHHLPPDDEVVREKIENLQTFITENYYTCNLETLRGLGALYANDERFRRYIDKAGGKGTAAFASRAILAYCTL